MNEDVNKSLGLRIYNYRMQNVMTKKQFGKVVGLSDAIVRRVEHGYDCLSDLSKAKIEAVIGKSEPTSAAPVKPSAPSVPFDAQKAVTPNSLARVRTDTARSVKIMTRENLLRVAWFLDGYNARDNNDALRSQIVRLQAMAEELAKEAGA